MSPRDWTGLAASVPAWRGVCLVPAHLIIMVSLGGLPVLNLLAGCGQPGAPIAPEDIGIAAKVEKDRKAAERDEQRDQAEEDLPGELPEDDVVLPPLRPVGTQ